MNGQIWPLVEYRRVVKASNPSTLAVYLKWEDYQATKQLKKGVYHSRIAMALPFETDKVKRVIVSSEEKKINIFE